jgi:hypothetical protein
MQRPGALPCTQSPELCARLDLKVWSSADEGPSPYSDEHKLFFSRSIVDGEIMSLTEINSELHE